MKAVRNKSFIMNSDQKCEAGGLRTFKLPHAL